MPPVGAAEWTDAVPSPLEVAGMIRFAFYGRTTSPDWWVSRAWQYARGKSLIEPFGGVIALSARLRETGPECPTPRGTGPCPRARPWLAGPRVPMLACSF